MIPSLHAHPTGHESIVRRLKLMLKSLLPARKRGIPEGKNNPKMPDERRAAAVEIVSLINQRYWATADLDNELLQVDRAIEKVEELGGRITALASSACGGWRDRKNVQQFLTLASCIGRTDVARGARKDLGSVISYSRRMPETYYPAFRTLAEVMPEVLDDEVRKEAGRDARLTLMGNPDA